MIIDQRQLRMLLEHIMNSVMYLMKLFGTTKWSFVYVIIAYVVFNYYRSILFYKVVDDIGGRDIISFTGRNALSITNLMVNFKQFTLNLNTKVSAHVRSWFFDKLTCYIPPNLINSTSTEAQHDSKVRITVICFPSPQKVLAGQIQLNLLWCFHAISFYSSARASQQSLRE